MGAWFSKVTTRQGHGVSRVKRRRHRRRQHRGRSTQPHFREPSSGGSQELLLGRRPGQGKPANGRQAQSSVEQGNQSDHDREPEAAAAPSTGRRNSSGGVQGPSLSPNHAHGGSLSSSALSVSHEDLERGTDGYTKRNLIGSGTFGDVFRGCLLGTDVAVKRSESRCILQNDFLEEVEFMKSLQHPNVLQLVAYCEVPGHWALAFELAPKGSLHALLHGSGRSSSHGSSGSSSGGSLGKRQLQPFSWRQRLKVLQGAAEGLSYLHQEVEVEGVAGMATHRRVTSSNVLVFDDWVGKIGDCRLQSPEEDSLLPGGSMPLGQFSCEAPEFVVRHEYTQKTDVYAFGVVMLETFCGRNATDGIDTNGTGSGSGSKLSKRRVAQEGVKDWVISCIRKRTYRTCLDPRLQEEAISDKGVQRFCVTISKCLKDMPAERPGMNEVAWAIGKLQEC